MPQVIYIDILVIINTYIGYILLSVAGLVCGAHTSTLRLLLAALLQGAYSLVILLPELTVWFRLPVRLAACAVFVLAAYKVSGKRAFIRLYLAFFGVTAAFAGAMTAVWLLFSPGGMSCNNGAVYFQIDALTLAVLTVVCYAAARLACFIIKRKAPQNSIFSMTVSAFDAQLKCDALLDTGNGLRDIITGLPVIVINQAAAVRLFSGKLPFELNDAIKTGIMPKGFRLIPCNTVSGCGMLAAFRPDSVTMSGVSNEYTTCQVLIGITADKMRCGEFEALIPSSVFENAEERRHQPDDENDCVAAEIAAAGCENNREPQRKHILHKRTGQSAGTAVKGRGNGSS